MRSGISTSAGSLSPSTVSVDTTGSRASSSQSTIARTPAPISNPPSAKRTSKKFHGLITRTPSITKTTPIIRGTNSRKISRRDSGSSTSEGSAITTDEVLFDAPCIGSSHSDEAATANGAVSVLTSGIAVPPCSSPPRLDSRTSALAVNEGESVVAASSREQGAGEVFSDRDARQEVRREQLRETQSP